ncbi:MAG: hypothetical protein PHU21_05620 [Elusimicrobia bacterium]|nr:hypothetical protein [Elusimicrobiota bacterium]
MGDTAGLPPGASGRDSWFGLERACLWLAVAMAASTLFVPELNPDLFWHLSAGKHILQTKAIPRADFLSHTMFGQPWCDFEWLSQLLYYPVYVVAGYAGFIALRFVLFCALMAVSLSVLSLFGLRDWARSLAVLFIMLGQNVSLRPDLFSLIFFGVAFWGLESFRQGRLKPRAAHLAWVALGFCLWSNLHLGFAFGLLLIGFYAAGDLIETALPWAYGRGWQPWERAAAYLGLLAAAVLGTLCNPYGWKVYEVLFDHARLLPVLQDLIMEWKPADVTRSETWPYWLLAVFSLSAALAHFIQTRRTSYAHLLALSYFLLVSSTHIRHRTFFFLVAVPLSLSWVRGLQPGRKWLRTLAALGALAGAAACFDIARHYWPAVPFVNRTKWCSEPGWLMCRFLAQTDRLKGKKLFNVWHHGGYLGWRLYPDQRVFFDGRYIFHDLLLEFVAALRRPQLWQRMLDRHGVEVACMQRSSHYFNLRRLTGDAGKSFMGGQSYYLTYMPKAAWALVYWDDENLVLVRRGSVDARWLAGAEYSHLLPDVQYIRTGRKDIPLLKRELARHLRQTQGRGLDDYGMQRWLGNIMARQAK